MPFKSKEAARKRSAAYYQMLRSTPEGRERLQHTYRRAMARYLAKPGVKEKRAQARKTEKAKLASRQRKLRVFYGMTVNEYEVMVARQNSCCAICFKKIDKLHVDHDHTTGMVRKLLCQRCNAAIGLLDDEPTRLECAAQYLREFGR